MLTKVSLDYLAFRKIKQHCEQNYYKQVTGQLLGLDDDTEVEITNTFPIPIQEEVSQDDYQIAMMKNLRQVNIDHNAVGWYQSSMNTCASSFISAQSIQLFSNYQTQIPNAVLLIVSESCITAYQLLHSKFKPIPISINCPSLTHKLPSFGHHCANYSPNPLLEMELMLDIYDSLLQDQYKYTRYTLHYAKQQQQIQNYVRKNGVAEDDAIFALGLKNLVEPSMGDFGVLCSQIEDLSRRLSDCIEEKLGKSILIGQQQQLQ